MGKMSLGAFAILLTADSRNQPSALFAAKITSVKANGLEIMTSSWMEEELCISYVVAPETTCNKTSAEPARSGRVTMEVLRVCVGCSCSLVILFSLDFFEGLLQSAICNLQERMRRPIEYRTRHVLCCAVLYSRIQVYPWLNLLCYGYD